jgi:DNA helicase-2/ATP-dependent DNA helicase PcrA
VDYKVSKGEECTDRNELQLRIHSRAGRREGYDVRGAYLHSLGESRRKSVAIDEAVVAESVGKVAQALSAIRASQYPPAASKKACSSCDLARIYRFCEKAVRADLEEWQGL